MLKQLLCLLNMRKGITIFQRLIHYVKQIPEEYCIKYELRMPH